jgi:hypothetical protein
MFRKRIFSSISRISYMICESCTDLKFVWILRYWLGFRKGRRNGFFSGIMQGMCMDFCVGDYDLWVGE